MIFARTAGGAATALVTLVGSVFAGSARADCDDVRALELPHTEIAAAESIVAGAHRVSAGPFGGGVNTALAEAPAFCRVALVARPSADSEINIEIWLPSEGWNGRVLATGNGGWAGSIGYSALASGLGEGYAVAGTDTGHTGGSVEFAVGHPEKLTDFAHRAVHDMAVSAKAVAAAHYGRAPEHAYFSGCSTGGRQALTAAQRYPADFDGIVAGASAYYPSHLQGMQVWAAAVNMGDAGPILDGAAFTLLNERVVASCDTLDGVADGVLENPRACGFDPRSLVCATPGEGACLTPQQAETAAALSAGPVDASGRSLFPGLARGSESGWNTLSGARPLGLAADTYGTLVFADPDWDFRAFDAARDIAIGAERIGALMDANDPDVSQFLSRGGKLILYHGWNDPGIPPEATIRYYEALVATVPERLAADGVRLFMVPGMNHCQGGVGTDNFDLVAALNTWLGDDAAPQRIEAARIVRGETVRTRPLCPYPAVASYDGSGSTDAAENFVCR
jgi:feruloyl esterase